MRTERFAARKRSPRVLARLIIPGQLPTARKHSSKKYQKNRLGEAETKEEVL
jgi:hypothetical protein